MGKPTLEAVAKWIRYVFENDRNNACLESYEEFKNDYLSYGDIYRDGELIPCRIYKSDYDDYTVFETDKDFFEFAIKDEEWLEDCRDTCKESIIMDYKDVWGVEYDY